MLTLEIPDSDIVETRFRISPIFDLEHLLYALCEGGPLQLGPFWSEEMRPVYAELRRAKPLISVLVGLLRSPYVPTFLAPPPESAFQTIDDDLRAVLATPAHVVAEEISRCLKTHQRVDPLVAKALRQPRLLDHLAEVLRAAWQALLDPWWPFLRIVLEADIRWRSEQLFMGGWSTALRELRPRALEGMTSFTIDIRSAGRMPIGGKGIVMIPSLFVCSAAAYTEPPWRPAIAYRARGAELALTKGPNPSLSRLSPVIGRARSAILAALDMPVTPSSLSNSLGMSLGAVGDNLARLLDVGLISRKRLGGRVEYRRTPLGDALLLSSMSPPGSTASAGGGRKRPARLK